jgi:hypothetical protein
MLFVTLSIINDIQMDTAFELTALALPDKMSHFISGFRQSPAIVYTDDTRTNNQDLHFFIRRTATKDMQG